MDIRFAPHSYHLTLIDYVHGFFGAAPHVTLHNSSMYLKQNTEFISGKSDVKLEELLPVQSAKITGFRRLF
jgi:hypothetical protein